MRNPLFKPRPEHWPQFSLRALLIVTTLFMVFVFGAIPFTDAMIVKYIDDRLRSRVTGMRLAIGFGVSSLVTAGITPREAASLVPLVALGSVARIAATVQATALRAIQLPALIFVAFCASSAVGFLVGIPSVWAFGLRGAVFATFLSNASAFVIISILLHRNSRRVVSQSAVLLPLVRIAGDS